MKKTANSENGKWKIVWIWFSIFYFLFSSSALFAAFLDNGVTARVAGLGDNYVALADDAAALAGNPAGLGSLMRPEVITDYSRLNMGLTDGSQISQSYVGGAMPLSIGGTLACGWKQLNFDSLYTERTLSLGYGRWWTPRLALGASVKQLHLAYHPADQIVDDFGNIQTGTPDLFAQNGTDKTAYSADIGALYKWNQKNTLGLTVQDINEPNMALSEDDRDLVTRKVRVALASEVRPHLTLAVGMHTQQTLANQRDWIGTGGGEMWFKGNTPDQIGLRGSLAVGNRDYHQIATGASYRIGDFQMDYGFNFNLGGIGLGDSYGNHRFSVAYRFGKTSSRPGTVELVFLRMDETHTDVYPTDDEFQATALLLSLDPTSAPKEAAYHAH